MRCIFAVICVLALASQLVIGCSSGRNGFPAAPTTGHVYTRQVLSVTRYPVPLVCRETGAKAELYIRVHRDYSNLTAQDAKLLDEAVLPYTRGGRLLYLYAISSVWGYLNGQPLPPGFGIEDQTAIEQMRRRGTWTVDLNEGYFSKSALALRDGSGNIWWLDGNDKLPSDWVPLNEGTWPDLWQSVEEHFHLKELFADADGDCDWP